MLITKLTPQLQIQQPIIQAGMGNEAGVGLVATLAKTSSLDTVGSIRGGSKHLQEQAVSRGNSEADWPLSAFRWLSGLDNVIRPLKITFR